MESIKMSADAPDSKYTEAGSGMFQYVFEMVRGKGLSALIEKFHAQGLGEVVSSWIGTGENKPITAEQVKGVMSPEHIAELSTKLGLPKEAVLSQLSGVLPQLVDKLTPDGKLPEGGIVERGMGMLEGVLTGFLHKPGQSTEQSEAKGSATE
jgi:uncharacterized protein YidB (DUF937 family)